MSLPISLDHFSQHNQLIFDMALKNCHVKGLHGIVFAKKGQYLDRMFIATSDQVLYQNQCPDANPENWGELSLAVHPHRIDIQIVVVTGTIWNIEFEKIKMSSQSQVFQAYKWNSHILGSEKAGGFEKVSEKTIKLKNRRKLCPGDHFKMRSDELHTVYVPKGQTASWFIIETEATGTYDGITYANHELEKWTSEGLYQKPNRQQVIEYLSIAGIELEKIGRGNNNEQQRQEKEQKREIVQNDRI